MTTTGALRIFDAAAVRAALPYATVIPAMARAMAAFSAGAASQPLRTALAPDGFEGSLLLKPAALIGAEPALAVKIVSLYPRNAERGLASVQGLVAVFDPATGRPLAILDGATVTEIRTAAVSAVATDRLARAEAGVLCLIGAGVQARAHIAAIGAVRALSDVRITNRTRQRAEALSSWARERGVPARVVDDPAAAVDGADIICTVTASPQPVLAGAWLAAGAHINAVGAYRPDMRELDDEAVVRAGAVVVDSREAAAAEAGDLLGPAASGVVADITALPELGELVAGERSGRRTADEITVFVSLGLAVQDVVAAQLVVSSSGPDAGVEVPFA